MIILMLFNFIKDKYFLTKSGKNISLIDIEEHLKSLLISSITVKLGRFSTAEVTSMLLTDACNLMSPSQTHQHQLIFVKENILFVPMIFQLMFLLPSLHFIHLEERLSRYFKASDKNTIFFPRIFWITKAYSVMSDQNLNKIQMVVT